jgi:hypothetical protein
MEADAPQLDIRAFGVEMSDTGQIIGRNRRRPVEAIEHRTRRSAECEQRVRRAIRKLTKTGAAFTVENVCDLAGVGKTFIYDKRHPALTDLVLAARDASQVAAVNSAEALMTGDTSSWRERALNAEAVAKALRDAVRERDARITALAGQLYDADGIHLVDENARLRDLVATMSANLQRTQMENATLQRSLDAARANVKRERERNVAQLFTQ